MIFSKTDKFSHESRSFSADGFSKAETLLEKVKTGLSGLSLVTVTIACLWVGYKVLFGGS
ncbi:TrbC/VirB2 family protein, partial [Escherichia coli]|uniref:TrbC/VirB2 family protein n=1 Tax=Escherichia coli TaxID=562 RepID=UPI003EE40EB9